MTRLVRSPIFILSSIRSGSTLLRCILNSHTQVHAPHELHLMDIRVSLASAYAELAVSAGDLHVAELEHLLWDRLLHRSLQASGKDHIVDKTPGNALHWRRLVECWPQARFVFLLRHPAQILESAYAANLEQDPEETKEIVLSLAGGVDEARHVLPGLVVRYEELAADPAQVTADVCAHLGVAFEPSMLNYRVPDHLVPGIGDFTDNIRTGRVQLPRPLAGAVGPDLADLCQRWGYADASA
ncbi:MAG: hypothetical protein QOE61_3692 [Micromonosporaceae bacterium]|jgi:hypothetical protein|nr:hypothetical protein [Micromonosporaceae bacterium]